MKPIIAILALLCAGCSTIAGNLPTLEHCDTVSYTRKGNQIDVVAHCSAPIGGGVGLPVK